MIKKIKLAEIVKYVMILVKILNVYNVKHVKIYFIRIVFHIGNNNTIKLIIENVLFAGKS